MAQTDSGGKTAQKEKLNINEIRAKVVAFKNQTEQMISPEILKGYLNFLCPTIEEKVAFVSMFDKIYPQERELGQMLAMWLDEEFAKHCNQQIVKEEINKLKGIYQAVFGQDAQEKTSKWEKDENPSPSIEEQASEQKKKKGLFSGIFGKLFGKKEGKVSKLDKEELNAAKSQISAEEKAKMPDYIAEYKLRKYNEKVARRAEMARSESLAYGKDMNVMSR